MAKTNYQSVDEYIAALPEAVRPTLERVRGIILKALPGAEETISYQLPSYRLHVIYLNAASKHFALYPSTEGLIEALGEEITPHLQGKGTMRFLFADPVPIKLIQRIVKIRAKEAEATAKKR